MDSLPIVLFGAFDRHNLGDFLLAHAARLRAGGRPCLFAGLRAADFRDVGAFAVEPVADVIAGWSGRFGSAPMELVHVGGEILDTDAWEAAVMLLEPAAAGQVVARHDRDPEGRQRWAAGFLGNARAAPYAIGPWTLPPGGRVEFRAVGGAGLAQRDPAFCAAVFAALAGADALSVRDRRTQAALAAGGVNAGLEPDPVTGLGPWLCQAIAGNSPPGGDYVAVQFAANFADDASLDALAGRLNGLGLPAYVFRAGAAPWHDEREACERLLPRLRVPVHFFASLHILDICALIAQARLCLASSLHALIVAGLFGIPAFALERRAGEGDKLRAYAETWGDAAGFCFAAPGGTLA